LTNFRHNKGQLTQEVEEWKDEKLYIKHSRSPIYRRNIDLPINPLAAALPLQLNPELREFLLTANSTFMMMGKMATEPALEICAELAGDLVSPIVISVKNMITNSTELSFLTSDTCFTTYPRQSR